MTIKRRTEINIEIERFSIVRQSGRNFTVPRCARCGPQAPMVTVDEAATLCHLSARAIFKLVEAEQVHFTETPDGRLLVCPDSLR